MSGYGGNPNDHGNNPYSSTNGYKNGSSPSFYSPADAMSYMATRAAANQAAYSAALPYPPGYCASRGPTYGDTYSPNSATAKGFGYGSRPSTAGVGRTTWHDGPYYPSGSPSADALRGAADMAATAARRARNPNGYIPGGGGNGSGPSSGFGGGWGGPNGPIPMGMAGSGWPGTTPGTSYGPARNVSGHHGANGHGDSKGHGAGNAWGHGGYNGNTWSHGGSGNGQGAAL
ncbi:hypothetical protein CI238_12456 [Colletotrichum incanum]|uniref:Uncharacterized protein n=1 Tax=Colletotrichum incanum TaxID=1573173 RepID=A0A166LMZ5_COLIC|nr:hypothetical protein CI238_12456 [Colletotrichum incanum]OHW97929.1 hypothetical protein CSPAE12_03299 [Colletotrichum incanum]